MKKRLIYSFYLLLICILSGYTDAAYAVCTVSTTPVSFGSYSVLSSSPLDAEGSITVSCNEAPPPTVAIAIGASPNSGGFSPRKMKLGSGSELIEYNLYIDTTRTQIWGDGTGSTFTKSQKARKNNTWENTVYGRVPPLQNISAGTYSETLTVTITW